MVEVAILIGLQGAGKTTFYRRHFQATHVHVSKDNFPNNRNKTRRQDQLLCEALQAGRPVVVDNTNPNREDRAGVIETARALGACVVGYFFDAPWQTCYDRNARRTGKARVPDVALRATAQRLTPPSMAEGFDRLFLVCSQDDETFTITPWPEVEHGPEQPRTTDA
jgi:predicted kinase